MAQEIKFNHFGVPYVVEFSNVSFRPTKPFRPRPTNTLRKAHTTPLISTLSRMSDSTTATRAPSPASSYRSSDSGASTRSRPKYRKYPSAPAEALTSWQFVPPHEPLPAPEPTPVERAQKGRGLYVQLSPSQPPQPGTDAPPSYTARPHPSARRASMARLQNLICEAVKKAGMEGPPPSEMQGETDRKDDSGSALPEKSSSKGLFKGTYGQVMTALNSMELMTTPCDEDGFDKAKRLGVLIVASPNQIDGVEFTRLTLWGKV